MVEKKPTSLAHKHLHNIPYAWKTTNERNERGEHLGTQTVVTKLMCECGGVKTLC